MTRSQTWPASLQLPEEVPSRTFQAGSCSGAVGGGSVLGNVVGCTQHGGTQRPSAFAVAAVSPLWCRVPSRRSKDASLAPPCALRQHFFLHRSDGDDVRARLYAEHGADGTWTIASAKRQRSSLSKADDQAREGSL